MTAADLIDEAARLINDAEPGYEHIRWSQSELLEYANDAVVQVALLRPDVFSQSETITLQPGARQSLPEGATRFYRVDGTLDRYSRLQGQPTRTDATAAQISRTWFAPLACPRPSDAYAVTAFQFDPNDPRAFTVEPPVPPGKPVQIVVSLARVPEPVAAGEELPIDRRFHNAVVEWMLYRAFSKDQDSAHDTAQSAAHLRHFYEMLGLSQRADERYYGQARSGSSHAESHSTG